VATNSKTGFRLDAEGAARYGKIRGLGLEIFQRKTIQPPSPPARPR